MECCNSSSKTRIEPVKQAIMIKIPETRLR
jgi:hypothetical protein